jgi:hypothetical protein
MNASLAGVLAVVVAVPDHGLRRDFVGDGTVMDLDVDPWETERPLLPLVARAIGPGSRNRTDLDAPRRGQSRWVVVLETSLHCSEL